MHLNFSGSCPFKILFKSHLKITIVCSSLFLLLKSSFRHPGNKPISLDNIDYNSQFVDYKRYADDFEQAIQFQRSGLRKRRNSLDDDDDDDENDDETVENFGENSFDRVFNSSKKYSKLNLKKQTKILIMGPPESGTPIIANYFKLLSNSLLIDEPLIFRDIKDLEMLEGDRSSPKYQVKQEFYNEEHLEMIENIYDCKMPVNKDQLSKLLVNYKKYNQEKYEIIKWTTGCADYNICYPQVIQDFFRVPFCQPSDILEENQTTAELSENCKTTLKAQIPKYYPNLCLSKKIVVAKTEKFRDPRKLLTRAIRLNKDFKIIYVIRDPRAIIRSQFSNVFMKHRDFSRVSDQIKMEIRNELLELKERLLILKSMVRDKKSLLVIRYEDYLQNPSKIEKNLSNFINQSNTASTKRKQSNSEFNQIRSRAAALNRFHHLEKTSTSSTTKRKHWVDYINYPALKFMQEILGQEFILELGYHYFTSESNFEKIDQNYKLREQIVHSWEGGNLTDIL